MFATEWEILAIHLIKIRGSGGTIWKSTNWEGDV